MLTPFSLAHRSRRQGLRPQWAQHTPAGSGLCAEHQKMFEDGFVALVECDPQRSGAPSGSGRMKPEQAYRTGQLAHLKREVFTRVFNVPVEAGQPCVFVDPGVIAQVQAMVVPAEN